MEHLDAEIYHLLRQVNGKMTCAIQEVFAPMGVTPPQVMILIQLRDQNALRLSELAEHLNMTCSNCSVICRRLEKAGLILRIRDRHDQRVVNLQLTKKAQEMVDTLNGRMERIQRNLLENATLEERMKIHEGLRLLNGLFNETKEG